MAKFYMANATQQNRVFYFRFDYNHEGDARVRASGVKQIQIRPGTQTTVAGELNPAQLKEIVPQAEQSGAVNIDTFNRLPKTQEVIFLFGIDKAVPARMIDEAHAHNRGVLRAQGELRRRQAAVGVSKVVEDHIDATVQKFEVEYEQMPDKEFDTPESMREPLVEGVRVDHNAPRESNRAARRAARQGRSVGRVPSTSSET